MKLISLLTTLAFVQTVSAANFFADCTFKADKKHKTPSLFGEDLNLTLQVSGKKVYFKTKSTKKPRQKNWISINTCNGIISQR